MIAPPALLRRPTAVAEQAPADEGLDLMALLLALDEPAWDLIEAAAEDRTDRPGAGLRAQVGAWSQRAAQWGAGPQGSWRAW